VRCSAAAVQALSYFCVSRASQVGAPCCCSCQTQPGTNTTTMPRGPSPTSSAAAPSSERPQLTTTNRTSLLFLRIAHFSRALRPGVDSALPHANRLSTVPGFTTMTKQEGTLGLAHVSLISATPPPSFIRTGCHGLADTPAALWLVPHLNTLRCGTAALLHCCTACLPHSDLDVAECIVICTK
jgi:hypothetical protein